MRDAGKAAKVGALVLLTLGATFLVYRLVEERASGDGGYGVWALFDDAQGLVPKSRVQVAGIQVGYIDEIRLQDNRARVDIHIDEGVTLYRDAVVEKRTASILGESILVLYPGTVTEPPVEDGARIAVAEGTPGTDEILRTVAQTVASVQRVAHQLELVFGTDEGGRQMASALRNLSEALEAANRMVGQNEEVIASTLRNVEEVTSEAGPRLVRILDNVEVVTRDVRAIVGENREGLTEGGGNVADTVASINRAARQLEQVLADVREVTGRTARGEGAVGRLTSDEDLADEIQDVVEGVGDFIGPITRLQTIIGLRSEYNLVANTFKNYVSLRIQPREDRYYLIELIDDPRGLTQFTQTTVRRSPPAAGEPASYQETRVTTRDAFRFSLLFAKRIHFVTMRFGIIESTGGVGVDFHMLDDHLELTTDLFAFGDEAFPRLRVRAAYEIVSRLWILAGIDDAINDSRDLFMGAALRFNDEDLKSILPFLGGAPGG